MLVGLFLFLFSQQIFAQPCPQTLTGTYTVGTGGDFTTLTSAVNAVNNSCISGNVVFLLTKSTYTSGESFPITIQQNPSMSAVNTVTIRPAAGISSTISGSVSSGALIRILSNQVTFDGSNNGSNSRNLTIINTSITEPRVILFGSTGTTPILNSSIKNCIIANGNTDKSCIAVSDGAAIATPGYFNNITIENNLFRRSMYGIYCRGVVQNTNGSGLVIRSNDLSSGSGNAIQLVGIYLEGVDGALIRDNLIGNFVATDSAIDKGIFLNAGTRNVTVMGNRIFNLNYTGNKGAASHGIHVASGVLNANITIVNNMISNISGDGNDYTNSIYNIDNPTGILLSALSNQSGIRIYHNSISLSGNTLNKPNAVSACIRMRSGSSADIRNNILVNRLGLLSTIGFGSACILVSNNSGQFTQLDYNDYVVAPTGSGLKMIGHIFSNNTRSTTLDAWKTATGMESNALNITPVFNSSTDLHLNPSSNAALNNKGIYIPGFAVDADYTSRNTQRPDMGWDEFVPAGTTNWLGLNSTDPNDNSNWEANVKSDLTRDLTLGPDIQNPIQVTDSLLVKNLNLQTSGFNPVIRLDSNARVRIFGNINTTGGKLDASKGILQFSGNNPQIFPAGLLHNNAIADLVIDNTHPNGLSLNGALDIYRALTFTTQGLRLNTNGNLTLKSGLTSTAYVGNLTGKTINGNVTVERFIPTGITHPKSWQLLSVPVYGNQTINQAWQDTATSANQSRYVGYGTQITSNINPLPPLFDVYTPAGTTLRVYNSATGNWDGLPNTINTPISNPKGYFVFVRGDRTVTTSNAPAVPTILRATGKLYTANAGETPPVINVSPDRFESVGNPYASAIDFRNLSLTGSLDSAFYVWDPLLSGTRGLGGYQLISATNGYLPLPGGTANYSGLEPVTTIQSGQAFFVHSTGNNSGELAFNESAKITSSSMVYRNQSSSLNSGIKAMLFTASGPSGRLADGLFIKFRTDGNNGIDGRDALKIRNPGENMAVSINASQYMLLERDQLSLSDTIQFSMSALQRQTYELRIVGIDFHQPDFDVVLVDRFTHAEFEIGESDTLYVPFTITADALSAASNRFFIYVRPTSTLPVRFLDVRATRKENAQVKVNWVVSEESGIESYHIERSSDGRHFYKVGEMNTVRNLPHVHTYEFEDNSTLFGSCFYRVSAIENGQVKMISQIVSIRTQQTGKIIMQSNLGSNNLQGAMHFIGFTPGTYQIRFFSTSGQLLLRKVIVLSALQQTETISLLNKPSSCFIQMHDKQGTLVYSTMFF